MSFSSNGTRNSTSGAGVWYTSGQFNLSLVDDRFTVGDYNGDGKADVAMSYDLGNGGMRIHRWIPTGSAFSGPPGHCS